jgi:acyl carrier protein
MDFLSLVEGLHETTGVEVPESDYDQLQTLDGLLAYLVARAA